MADAAYDADHLRQAIAAKVPSSPNDSSRALKIYTQRHLVECCFFKLEQFHRVETRFEKSPNAATSHPVGSRAILKKKLDSGVLCSISKLNTLSKTGAN